MGSGAGSMCETMNPILVVDSLTKVYTVTRGVMGRKSTIRALDGVTIEVFKGETLGVVGESGCGKSTLGRLIVRLDEPTAGIVLFRGKNISHLRGEDLMAYRRRVQLVFQDPASSLNPKKTVGQTLTEPLIIHNIVDRNLRRERVAETISQVGLSGDYIHRYPHELSGGQRQRVGIARALIVAPELIVADEPVSSLDVSIQAQILNLLKDLRDLYNLTYIFISHDLNVVRFMSDRIAVLYRGRIMELASSYELYENPLHPYTRTLLAAIPGAKRHSQHSLGLKMDEDFYEEALKGCPFYFRCNEKENACKEGCPPLVETGPAHFVSCFVRSS